MTDDGNGKDSPGDREGDLLIDQEYDTGTSPSFVVIQTLAALENVDPTDLTSSGVQLHDHVDPEALDRLLADDKRGAIVVSFTLSGYLISITNSGRICVIDGK